LRAVLAAALRCARSAVASALSLIESDDGGSEEFLELFLTSCSSSVILAFSRSISAAWVATRVRSPSFSIWSSERSPDTLEIRPHEGPFRELPGQQPC